MSQKEQLNEMKQFMKIAEGAWQLPRSKEDFDKLAELLGSEVTNAEFQSKIYNILGSDSLFDKLDKLDPHAVGDAGHVTIEWMQEQRTSEYSEFPNIWNTFKLSQRDNSPMSEDEYDEEDSWAEHFDMANAQKEKFKGRTIIVTDFYDGDVFGIFNKKRFMISSPLDRGWGVGEVSDDEIEVSDLDYSLSPKEEEFLRAWHRSHIDESVNDDELSEAWSDANVLSSEEWTKRTGASGTRKFLVRITGPNEYVVYDRLAIRDDVVAGPFEHDDQAWDVADEHEKKYNQGYADWLARGNKGMEPGAVKLAAYDEGLDEDDDADGMGSYDIIWNEDSWKEAIPYDVAEKEVQRILQIIDDSALQAHDNNDHLKVKKTAKGDTMIWTVLDPIDGDYQEIRIQPSDMPAGYTGESIEEDNLSEELPPIHAIARDIIKNWKKVNFGAVPYLDAMQSLSTKHDDYGADSGSSILAYGLSNMTHYSGRSVHDPELAKKHRAQLKQHLKEGIDLESVVENVLQEFPGQPKDYDEGDYDPDEADQREMADDMDNNFEKDYIDPEIEDEELGLRFD